MKTRKIKLLSFSMLFPVFIGIQLMLTFFNKDIYFQLSGFYIPFLLALVVGVLYIFQRRRKIPFTITTLLCLLFLVYLLLSSLFYHSSVQSGYVLSYLLIIIFILILEIGRFGKSKKEKFLLFFGYVCGGLIVSILQIVFRVRFYELDATRITIQITGTKIDPNYLAAFLIGPFFIAIYCCLKIKRLSNKLFFGLASLIILLGIVFTGSRGAIVSIVIGFLCIAIFKLRRVRFKRLLFVIFTLFVLLVLALVFVPGETMARFFNSDYLVDGSNIRRLSLWGNALRSIMVHPIFGNGARNTSLITGEITKDFEPAHNTLFDIWLQIGIIGVVFLVFLVVRAFKTKSLLFKGMCIATLLAGMFIAAESCLFFWMNFLIGIYFSDSSKVKKTSVKKTHKLTTPIDLPDKAPLGLKVNN